MLKEGLSYTSTTTVGVENSAATMGSGNLAVFATPSMIALMENAAMNAVQSQLPDGGSTVGTHLNVAHTCATPFGGVVEATATLRVVDGRKLMFDVVAKDGNGVIGEGTHERFIVDTERFMSKLT